MALSPPVRTAAARTVAVRALPVGGTGVAWEGGAPVAVTRRADLHCTCPGGMPAYPRTHAHVIPCPRPIRALDPCRTRGLTEGCLAPRSNRCRSWRNNQYHRRRARRRGSQPVPLACSTASRPSLFALREMRRASATVCSLGLRASPVLCGRRCRSKIRVLIV